MQLSTFVQIQPLI